jgi:hypothetical protein
MTDNISLLPRHCGIDDGLAAPTALDQRVLLSSMVHDFNIFLTPIVSVLEEMQGRWAGTARQPLDFASPRSIRLRASRQPSQCGSL